MAKSSIHASERVLSKVFSNDFVFNVPNYQRPYMWGLEQANQLLDDLLTFLGDDETKPISELDPYFLGSIVLIKGDSPEADVVDGQQRLTTLTILLSALRHCIEDRVLAEEATIYLYEKGMISLGTPNRYRLSPRAKDVDFFRKYIQEPGGLDLLPNAKPTSDSQMNMKKNALGYVERLMGLPSSRRARLFLYLVQKCYLVVVSTPDDQSAFRIFSVLNDRGLDLTHADILKAEIIGAMPPDIAEEYSQKWENIEDELGHEAFRELFGHIRMIVNPAKMQKTVLEEIRQYAQPRKNPKGFVDDVLIPHAESFLDVSKASFSSTHLAEEINRVLTWLKRVDNSDWVPPALLFVSRNRAQPNRVLEFLKGLDRLAYGFMITRAYVNERIARYGRIISAIKAGEHLFAPASPLQLSDHEKNEIVEKLNGPIYEITALRMPLLLRLDEALSSGGARYDYPIITIEHVLPQNPDANSQWLRWFPDPSVREQIVHKLGNLVLLTSRKNPQARNFDFAKKKASYFASKGGVSPFAITTLVLQEDEWTPEVVEAHQKKFISVLKNLWDL